MTINFIVSNFNFTSILDTLDYYLWEALPYPLSPRVKFLKGIVWDILAGELSCHKSAFLEDWGVWDNSREKVIGHLFQGNFKSVFLNQDTNDV